MRALGHAAGLEEPRVLRTSKLMPLLTSTSTEPCERPSLEKPIRHEESG